VGVPAAAACSDVPQTFPVDCLSQSCEPPFSHLQLPFKLNKKKEKKGKKI
jgi:hypothetical protein